MYSHTVPWLRLCFGFQVVNRELYVDAILEPRFRFGLQKPVITLFFWGYCFARGYGSLAINFACRGRLFGRGLPLLRLSLAITRFRSSRVELLLHVLSDLEQQPEHSELGLSQMGINDNAINNEKFDGCQGRFAQVRTRQSIMGPSLQWAHMNYLFGVFCGCWFRG